MERTGYWENVVVRQRDGHYEQAHGHHRVAAAIELYGADHEAAFIVRDFDDEQMFTSMVDENARDRRSDAALDQLAVKSLVAGFGAGRLTLNPPEPRSNKTYWRYADAPDGGRTLPYTARAVAAKLGWDEDRAQFTLGALDLLRDADLPPDTFAGIGTTAARDIVTQARAGAGGAWPMFAILLTLREDLLYHGYVNAQRSLASGMLLKVDREHKAITAAEHTLVLPAKV